MPSSDAFRPRLPIDPFATVDSLAPWHVPQDLPHSPPQVILILGEPPKNDLLSLLTSTHLAQSLLLIATHAPPTIPAHQKSTPGPNVCILRLSSPLAVHDNGALRLVRLFERAHRVAARWRESTQNPPLSASEYRFIQLAECRDSGEFTVSEPFLFVDRNGKTVQSLSSPLLVQPRKFRLSSHSLLPPNGSTFSSNSTTSLPTSPSSSGKIQRKKLRRISVTQPSPYSLSPPRQENGLRAFDALLNFLPSGVPDKDLLKHAILVTTLSAQYLALPDKVRDESVFPTSKSTARFSSPGPSSYSFSSSVPSSTSSSMTHSMSMATTPATSPSPSPPLTPSPFSQESGESTNYLNRGAPKGKGTIKPSFAKRLSSLLRPSSSSASTAPTLTAIDGGATGVSYASGRAVDARANDGWDGRGYAHARPRGTPTRPKNAHLVHILPLDWVDWEEQLREESARDLQKGKGKGKPSGPRYRVDGVNPADYSHTSANLYRHHDVGGNVASSSKRWTTATTSRVPAKPKLAQGIEQFLLTFAYPLGSLGLGHGVPSSSRSAQGHGDSKPALTGLAAAAAHAQTRPVPYLLAPGVFGRALDGAREEYPRQNGGNGDYDHAEALDARQMRRALVIGEIILLGALDFDPDEAYGEKDAYNQEKGAYNRYSVEDGGNARAVGGGRAWVAIGDVICSQGEEWKERGLQERLVVDRDERDRRVRETERRLEAYRTPATNTRNATQSRSQSQLPTPPDSSSSGESVEEAYPQDRYRTLAPPHQPTRVYASTKEPELERHRDSSRTSRRESVGASTSQRGGLGSNPTPAPMSGQPWPSSAAQASAVRSMSRSMSNPPVLPHLASNGPPPPRPGRSAQRTESASARIPSAQTHRVERSAIPPAAYSYGSSQYLDAPSPKSHLPARDVAPPVSSGWNEAPSGTTRTYYEPSTTKNPNTFEVNHAARRTYDEQEQLPTRPRATPTSNSAEAAYRNRHDNVGVRDPADFQLEMTSNKLRKEGHDHGLGHAMRKLGLWKLKAT
ncbi:hypothetical protein M413DRAFT_23062 [Hebeloma cylindrosporum]|uniref:Uncharacterized protein n=1 Tax=Hebeloma cylindrosporum TaxID=76867 RepID=A0A0C2YA45_HEBCY|nr:hypothetical protein M413DRAFT_23062 [Hebeloma cylindrosporum h7]